eukprot:175660-Rhodomonas_salina.4
MRGRECLGKGNWSAGCESWLAHEQGSRTAKSNARRDNRCTACRRTRCFALELGQDSAGAVWGTHRCGVRASAASYSAGETGTSMRSRLKVPGS